MHGLTKKQTFWVANVALLLLMVASIPLAIWITHTSSAQLENAKRRCEGKQQNLHTVTIRKGVVTPAHIDATRCDRLEIINQDDSPRLIAFGPHDKHISYNGVSEGLLRHDQKLTLTLGVTGAYPFHDHDDWRVSGIFNVHRPTN